MKKIFMGCIGVILLFTSCIRTKNVESSQLRLPPQTITGSFIMKIDSSSPPSVALPTNNDGYRNFLFTKIFFENTSSQTISINKLQLGTLIDPKPIISNIRVYMGDILIGEIESKDFYNVVNNTYAYWLPIQAKILVREHQLVIFSIKADILPSKYVKPGLFSLGFSGINLETPGARGNGIAFGNVMAIN